MTSQGSFPKSSFSDSDGRDAIAQFFDGRAARYDEMVNDANYAIPDWVKVRAGSVKGNSVLDLACGTGNLGAALQEVRPDFRFVGVDLSGGMVRITRERGFYLAAHQADLSEGLPEGAKGQAYDLIIALGFLEFLTQPAELLREMADFLNPGGRIWCSVEKTEPESVKSGVIRPELGFAMHHYSEDEVRDIVAMSGLEIIEMLEVGAYVRTYDQALVPWWVMECGKGKSDGGS